MENKLLQDLLEQRDNLLKEHPELQELQDKIDKVLTNTPQKHRMDVIGVMMSERLIALQNELLKLIKVGNGS